MEIYPISVLFNDGLKEILYKTKSLLDGIEREPLEVEEDFEAFFKILEDKKPDWIVEIDEDNVFNVSGKIIDNVFNTYVFNGDEGMINFLHLLNKLGLEKELRNAGIEEFDTVRIENYEFEFVE